MGLLRDCTTGCGTDGALHSTNLECSGAVLSPWWVVSSRSCACGDKWVPAADTDFTSPSHCPGTAATSGHSTTRRTPPSGCTLDTGPSSLTGKHLTFKEKYQKKFTNRCNTSFTCLSKMLSHFQCSNVHS